MNNAVKVVLNMLHNEYGIELTEVDLAEYVVDRISNYPEPGLHPMDVMGALTSYPQEVIYLRDFQAERDPMLKAIYEEDNVI
jgi:hypothetical protein